jgi:hypothetical protein
MNQSQLGFNVYWYGRDEALQALKAIIIQCLLDDS